MNKKSLSERDICSKFTAPAVLAAGWDLKTQVRGEVGFTKGRIIVGGKLVTRGKAKRADYVLSHKPNLPLALIEAKDNTFSVGAGVQQALEYAETFRMHDECDLRVARRSLPPSSRQFFGRPKNWRTRPVLDRPAGRSPTSRRRVLDSFKALGPIQVGNYTLTQSGLDRGSSR